MNTHPFYPILISNTSYANKNLRHRGPRVCKKIFLIKAKKKKNSGCPKSTLREGKYEFMFFYGASEIKSREKSRIFPYRLPEGYLSKGQKPQGG